MTNSRTWTLGTGLLMAAPMLSLSAQGIESRGILPVRDAQTVAPIRTERVVLIATEKFPAPSRALLIARLADQTHAIVSADQVSIGIFAPNGTLVRTVGRNGSGPGEFRGIHAIVKGEGDSIHVFDQVLRRETVFDPVMKRAARDRPAPSFRSASFVRQRLIVSDAYRESPRVGYSLHFVDSTGGLASVIGSRATAYNVENPSDIVRLLSQRLRGDGLLAMHTDRYRFDLWDESLRNVRSYERTVDWFRPQTALLWTKGGILHPRPLLVGGVVDSLDFVWLAIAVPSGRWKQQSSSIPLAESSARAPALYVYSNAFDTVIEKVELRSQLVVARGRIRGLATFIPGTTELARTEETSDGDATIEVLRPQVLRTRKSPFGG